MKPKELYAQIRKEKTEEALTTGESWICVVDSIPLHTLTYDYVEKLSLMVQEQKPSRIPAVRFQNILTGAKKTMAEVLQEVNL